jgi:hypothetical protein
MLHLGCSAYTYTAHEIDFNLLSSPGPLADVVSSPRTAEDKGLRRDLEPISISAVLYEVKIGEGPLVFHGIDGRRWTSRSWDGCGTLNLETAR